MDDNRSIFSKPSRGVENNGEEVRKYLVSELLPFVPPAIAAQSGIPMELEVSIPMPADGSGEVKLSTIYQACPKLFAAEITPLNDSEITLPVKISGFTSEEQFASSPFVPGKAFGGDSEEISKPKSHLDSESSNPFWSPVSEPGKIDSGDKRNETAAEKSPETEAPKKAEPPAQFGGFDEPAPRHEEKEERPAEPDPVEAGFSGMPFGGGEDFVTLFSNEEPSEDESATDDDDLSPSTSWGSMFQSPKRDAEAAKDDEETDKFAALGGFEDFSSRPEEVAEETVEKTVHEPLPPQGFEAPTEEVLAAPEAKSAPQPTQEGWGSEPENAEEPESEPESFENEPEPAVNVENESKSEMNVIPDSEPEPKQEATLAPIGFQAPEKPKPEIEWSSTPAAPQPDPAPVATEPAIAEKRDAPVSSIAQGSKEDDLADVELRAIFSTSERFTLAKLARKVVGLPGIAACALSGSGKVVQASKSEENQLGAGAYDMVDAVRNIAKMTGMDQARSFTMKTEFGVVSLFLEGDCCLSVNHAEGEFGPGVREKLIVIARSLHKLSD